MVLIAQLFLIAGLIGLFWNLFLSFPYSRERQKHSRNEEIYKGIFVVAFIGLGIYAYDRQSKKKTLILQEQYFNLFTDHPSPMGIVDLETKKFLAVNKASIDCYGYSKEEFLSIKVSDINVKDEESLMERDLSKINSSSKKSGRRKHRKKNGEIILTEVSASEVYFKNKKCILLLSNDISEMVEAKEAKRVAEEEKVKQQNFTTYVLENFPVDVAVFDKDHKYIFINKTAIKNDEIRQWMIGKDDFDYFARKGTDMSIAEKRRKRFAEAVAGESKEWIDEYIVNGQVKYLLRNFYPYYEEGVLKYVYGYGMDITEVKKAQIQRDQYTKQLEDMAFITSHRIRQPICNLQGLISLLEMEKCESREVQKLISCMHKSISIMDDFTKDLAVKLNQYKQNLLPDSNII